MSNNVYWWSYPSRWPSVCMPLSHDPNPNPYSPWKEIVLQTSTHPCITSYRMFLLILSHTFPKATQAGDPETFSEKGKSAQTHSQAHSRHPQHNTCSP